MATKHILAILFLGICSSLCGQTTITIKGLIEDSARVPVEKAVVQVRSVKDAKRTILAVTDKTGGFVVEIGREPFVISVSAVGFERFESEYYYLPQGNLFTLNKMVLRPQVAILNEVVVKNSIPAIVIKEDTIEYKVDSFLQRPGEEIEQLFKRLKGFRVEKDGSIYVNGKQIKKIMVNGKDFFGSDPSNVAKNIPADIVDKIQVIDDYGEAASLTGFKTDVSDKVINLQLKKDKNVGYFGKIEAVGTDLSRGELNTSFSLFTPATQSSFLMNSTGLKAGSFITNTYQYGTIGQLTKSASSFAESIGGSNNLISILNNSDQGFLAPRLVNLPGLNNVTSAGLNLNYEKDKLKIYGSYLYLNAANRNSIEAVGKEIIPDQILDNKRYKLDNQSQIMNRLFLNCEYKFSERSLFKVSVQASLLKAENRSIDSLLRSFNGDTLNFVYQAFDRESRGQQMSGTLMWKQQFVKPGRTLVLIAAPGVTQDSSINHGISSDLIYGRLISNQINQRLGTNFSFGSEVNYVDPLSKNLQLMIKAGESYRSENSDVLLSYYDPNSKTFVTDAKNSGLFKSKGLILYAGTDVKFRKNKIAAIAGLQLLKVEQRQLHFDKKIDENIQYKFTPRLTFNYKPSQTISGQFSYLAYYNLPSIRQLSPIADTVNPLVVYKGNPALRPELVQKANISFSKYNMNKGTILFLGMSADKTIDKIVQNVSLTSNNTQVITYTNADVAHSISAFYNYSQPFLNKLVEFTISGGGTFSTYPITNDQKIAEVHTSSGNQLFQVTFNPSLQFDFNVNENIVWNNFTSLGEKYKSTASITSLSLNWYVKNLKFNASYRYFSYRHYLLSNISSANIGDINCEYALNKTFIFRTGVNDLFGQTSHNISRVFLNNQFSDQNYLSLGRYYYLSLAIRFSKFKELMKSNTLSREN
jgi:hypothetical protein